MSLRGPRGEHAFQKKIPSEKKSLFGRQLSEIELFSKKAKTNFAKTLFLRHKTLKSQTWLSKNGKRALKRKPYQERGKRERERRKRRRKREREQERQRRRRRRRRRRRESESKEKERKTENEKEKKREEDNQQQKLTRLDPFLTHFGTILGFILVTFGVPFGGPFLSLLLGPFFEGPKQAKIIWFMRVWLFSGPEKTWKSWKSL